MMLFALTAPLHAQSFARVVGTVRSQAGEPLKGVAVSLVDPEGGKTVVRTATNAKGRYSIRVPDADRVYLYRYEKRGYVPREEQFRPSRAFSNTIRNVVLTEAPKRPVQNGPTAGDVFNKGVAAYNAGNYRVAEEKFSKALQMNPDLVGGEAALARVYLGEHKYQQALASAERMLAADPKDQVGLSVQYEAYRAQGQTELAKEAYARLVAVVDPAVIAYDEGKEAVRRGDVDAAKEHFQEAARLDPKMAAAHEALAWIHLNAGEHASAAQEAEQVLGLEPDNISALTVQYEAARALGHEAAADATLKRMYKIAPHKTATHFYQQAVKLFNADRITDAEAIFQQILQHRPDHARSHYMLGLCLVNRGKKAQAEEHLNKFLELAPDDPDAKAARSVLAYLEKGTR